MNMERSIGSGGQGAEQDPRPVVALPSGGFGGGAIALGGAVLALFLFAVLNQQRLERQHPPERQDALSRISAPPPLALPNPAPQTTPAALAPLPASPLQATGRPPVSEPIRYYRSRALHPVVIEQWPPPEPVAQPVQSPPGEPPWAQASDPQPAPLPTPTYSGPGIVQDNGESRQWSGADPAAEQSPAVAASASSAASSRRQTSAASASPRPIGDVAQVIAVGTMIEAVLETPIDSSRPGLTRAIVSRPVRSFDGSRVLIPRGARLVGEIRGQGQGSRLLVQWNQLILPNGAALDINSPGADASGRAGLDARSHNDVGRAIGGLLQSAVGIGAAVLGARAAPIYYAVPVSGQVGQLVPRGSGSKRYTVEAGAQINVVVARTLDFGRQERERS